ASIARNLRKLYKQTTTITFTALLRLHEQIFEIKSRSPKPRGKIVKVNCKPDRRFLFKSEQNFRHRPFTEQNINQLFLSRDDLVRRALIRRQIANELQNDRHILYACRT